MANLFLRCAMGLARGTAHLVVAISVLFALGSSNTALAAADPVDAGNVDLFSRSFGDIVVCRAWGVMGGVNYASVKKTGQKLIDNYNFNKSEAVAVMFRSTELWCPGYSAALQNFANSMAGG
ncbi:hypothetical protein GAN17_20070 [Mycobacterium kubicae]|uniref:hypothetical protein n=1 Tax=Mycobacterium kubicae TaxID=120959 RepID=UPI00163FD249|nr:hypothetical protein [Mycobacterium kubicae]QNI08305.1 hypothetical protein GAN17_20070 [Mycobacterium kubicae]